MNVIQFIQTTVNGLHQAIVNDVKGLTPAQLKYKPAPKANPVGFLFWHAVRIEDNNIAAMQKKATVWEEDQWYSKLGLDAKAFGTGFAESDVDKIAKLPIDDILTYADKVFRNTSVYIQSLDQDKLDYAPNTERPNWTVGSMLNTFVIAHGCFA